MSAGAVVVWMVVMVVGIILGNLLVTLFTRKRDRTAAEELPVVQEGLFEAQREVAELRTERERDQLWASRQYRAMLELHQAAIRGLEATGVKPYRDAPPPGRAELEAIERRVRQALGDMSPDVERFVDSFLEDEEDARVV